MSCAALPGRLSSTSIPALVGHSPCSLSCPASLATGLDWSWTYEALAMCFVHAADLCALHVRAFLARQPASTPLAPALQPPAPAGVWDLVLRAWDVFSAWLNRVVGVSSRLADCVSAERSAEMMARGRPDTPTLSDCGKAAFRSQAGPCQDLRLHFQHIRRCDCIRVVPTAGCGELAFTRYDVQVQIQP